MELFLLLPSARISGKVFEKQEPLIHFAPQLLSGTGCMCSIYKVLHVGNYGKLAVSSALISMECFFFIKIYILVQVHPFTRKVWGEDCVIVKIYHILFI